MRRLSIIILVLWSAYLFSGCCAFNFSLGKKERRRDIDTSLVQKNGQQCEITANLDGVKRIYTQHAYTNKRDGSREKLGYYFMVKNKAMRPSERKPLPDIVIHSFTFTKKENRDTVPLYLYYQTTYLESVLIDSLPCSIRVENAEDKPAGIVAIYAESDLSYKRPYKRGVRKLYVSYDIEIDGNRIIKQNIKYRRRLSMDCRWEFW
ncbi:MAG: hypothetical protein LBV02_05190 [Bacteroidales bacterium]|jgi:hypothetical protein|nr:hypothetical protein [Bacteroidales bacterium]